MVVLNSYLSACAAVFALASSQTIPGYCTSDSDCTSTICSGKGPATCQAAGMGQSSGVCTCPNHLPGSQIHSPPPTTTSAVVITTTSAPLSYTMPPPSTIVGPTTFCEGLSPGGSSCMTISAGCYAISPTDNTVPQTTCTATVAVSTTSLPPSVPVTSAHSSTRGSMSAPSSSVTSATSSRLSGTLNTSSSQQSTSSRVLTRPLQTSTIPPSHSTPQSSLTSATSLPTVPTHPPSSSRLSSSSILPSSSKASAITSQHASFATTTSAAPPSSTLSSFTSGSAQTAKVTSRSTKSHSSNPPTLSTPFSSNFPSTSKPSPPSSSHTLIVIPSSLSTPIASATSLVSSASSAAAALSQHPTDPDTAKAAKSTIENALQAAQHAKDLAQNAALTTLFANLVSSLTAAETAAAAAAVAPSAELAASVAAAIVAADAASKAITEATEAGDPPSSPSCPPERRWTGHARRLSSRGPTSCYPSYKGNVNDPTNIARIIQLTCTNKNNAVIQYSANQIVDALKQGVRYALQNEKAARGEYPHTFTNTPGVDNVTFDASCNQASILEFPILSNGDLLAVGKNSKADVGTDRVLFSFDPTTKQTLYCGLMTHHTATKINGLLPFTDCVP